MLLLAYLIISIFSVSSEVKVIHGFVTSSSNSVYPTRQRLSTTTSRVPLFSAAASNTLITTLQEYECNRHFVFLTDDGIPVTAEVFVNGTIEIGKLTVQFNNNDNEFNNNKKPFIFKVKLENSDDELIVDLGQITTIWTNNDDIETDITIKDNDIVISEREEVALDRLYRSRIGRARAVETKLTKKRIQKIIIRLPVQEQENAMKCLRQVVKAGKGLARVIDSSIAVKYLNNDDNNHDTNKRNSNNNNNNNNGNKAISRIEAAKILAHDAIIGGRFKRYPSILVATDLDNSAIIILNGGWLVVDQSVRAGTEARKFVQRGLLSSDNNDNNKDSLSSSATTSTTSTIADERIVRRLECLAMGELLFGERNNNNNYYYNNNNNNNDNMELDVREVLQNMNLPQSAEGAKEALIQMGYWTSDARNSNRIGIAAWSTDVINAANWYSNFIIENYDKILANEKNDRVDLRGLPCISIDAQKTTFRDDAYGVRSRASTGRKVIPEASKWEILIHIADVSDLYVTNPSIQVQDKNNYLECLCRAAQSRGSSRYDLPLGPLHLLPPVVLESLSFSETRFSRCVTLWAYIDERNGKLLDAGIERSIVSPPQQFSFNEASALMQGSVDGYDEKSRAVLLVVERNLMKWNQYHQSRSSVAKKREERLVNRELENGKRTLFGRDNGSDGFQRTRGHRLVDAGLDLYAFAASVLLKRVNVPIPRVPGADATRGGRVATAPLRRYVDGQAQRQLLATFCNYGEPLSLEECQQVAMTANIARNKIANVKAFRKK